MTQTMATTRIRPKDRDAILQSLRAGVVPRTGLQHVAVGRPDEIRSLIADIARIADGGSALPVRHRRVRLGEDVLPPADPLDRAAEATCSPCTPTSRPIAGCRPPAGRPAACSPS